MRNNFFKVIGLVGLALFLSCAAYADGTTVSMVFTGVNGANDQEYYVSPYYGTMNGAPVTLFCDDINNEVTWGQTWTANVTSMASSNFSNTRYGSFFSSNPYATSPQMLYEEAAWLVTQFASHPGDYVALQYALWDLMTPNAESTGYSEGGISVLTWLQDAEAGYTSINPADFEIITNVPESAGCPTGTTCLAYNGQVQEFIVETPEPSSLALLVTGMLALMLLVIRRGRV